jgi:hypothetical protein
VSPHRYRLIALLAGLLALAGCASTPAAQPPPASSAPASVAAEVQYASNKPPAAALLLCSQDVRGEVIADALNVPSVPAPESSWADHVYTCTYALQQGTLVLAVTVAPSDPAARTDLESMRSQLGAATQEPGLGQKAYSTAAGTVVAVKDNLVLRVDATGMADDLGNTHESRLDFARVIAAGVFSCWAGN